MAQPADTTMPRSASWSALWRALRPHQWVKNALVFAPVLLAHRVLDEPARLGATVLAAACLCAVSSAGYLLNDWLDRESDRQHPSKRHRPLASGELSERRAVAGFAA